MGVVVSPDASEVSHSGHTVGFIESEVGVNVADVHLARRIKMVRSRHRVGVRQMPGLN